MLSACSASSCLQQPSSDLQSPFPHQHAPSACHWPFQIWWPLLMLPELSVQPCARSQCPTAGLSLISAWLQQLSTAAFCAALCSFAMSDCRAFFDFCMATAAFDCCFLAAASLTIISFFIGWLFAPVHQ